MKKSVIKITKDTMVLGWIDFWKRRICIRNKWSKHFYDFPLFTLHKANFMERIEYKFGIIGIEFVLMIFK